MSELQTTNVFSPFDEGRIPCPQGGEDRWSARWLMAKMGYDKWQNFEQVIERAKVSAHNQGFNVRTLFTAISKKGDGRPQTEYQVTRFAAYLIAMNGDPRKAEVAAAQTYFAVKTREAEVRPVLTEDEIVHQALAITARRVETLTARVAELEPKAEFYDELMEADGTYSFMSVAKMLGWGRNVMMRELRRNGVLQGNNLPYQRYAHHFKVIPGTYTNRKTGETVPTATTTVLPTGVEFLRKKLSAVAV